MSTELNTEIRIGSGEMRLSLLEKIIEKAQFSGLGLGDIDSGQEFFDYEAGDVLFEIDSDKELNFCGYDISDGQFNDLKQFLSENSIPYALRYRGSEREDGYIEYFNGEEDWTVSCNDEGVPVAPNGLIDRVVRDLREGVVSDKEVLGQLMPYTTNPIDFEPLLVDMNGLLRNESALLS